MKLQLKRMFFSVLRQKYIFSPNMQRHIGHLEHKQYQKEQLGTKNVLLLNKVKAAVRMAKQQVEQNILSANGTHFAVWET